MLATQWALWIVIAITHFYIAKEEDVAYRVEMKKLSVDELVLSNMVSEFHGNKAMRACPRHLMIDVNDTQDFATDGTQPDRSLEIGLVATSALSDSRTLPLKNVDNSTKMNRMRGSSVISSAPEPEIVHLQST